MDFAKLAAQRTAKAEVSELVTEGQLRSKPGRKPSGTSKRQGWKAATFYLRPETLNRLRRVVMERKLAEAPGAADQSEAVEEALQAWLELAEKSLG